MKKTTLLLLILTIAILCPTDALAEEGEGEEEDVDCFEALQSEPWQDLTHSHDDTNMPNHSGGSGTHTHARGTREIQIGNCYAWEEATSWEHQEVDPKPPTPIVEDYTKPIVLTCVAGPCLERPNPERSVGPADIHGNVPPDPVPGEPELFYPTIEIDGVHYWDSTRPPYQVSEEAKDAEIADGYRLQDIDGQLFLVPLKHIPVDPAAPAQQQETFTTYTVSEVIDGQSYLEPAPFHADPVDDAADTRPDDEQPQDAQDGQDSDGASYASLEGQFYQVTSNPAIPIQVTEYMVEGWANGQKKLPQWIELYNPNTLAVNLVGYEFSYVFKKQTHTIQLGHFLIPPESAAILATHIPRQRYRYEGISDAQVYNLDIENALRLGWLLKDPTGQVISEVGKVFGQKDDPVKPSRVGLSRVSYNVYPSQRTRDTYFFGFREDVSTPGFHEPPIPRSPALLRQKMRTTWASFKKK